MIKKILILVCAATLQNIMLLCMETPPVVDITKKMAPLTISETTAHKIAQAIQAETNGIDHNKNILILCPSTMDKDNIAQSIIKSMGTVGSIVECSFAAELANMQPETSHVNEEEAESVPSLTIYLDNHAPGRPSYFGNRRTQNQNGVRFINTFLCRTQNKSNSVILIVSEDDESMIDRAVLGRMAKLIRI